MDRGVVNHGNENSQGAVVIAGGGSLAAKPQMGWVTAVRTSYGVSSELEEEGEAMRQWLWIVTIICTLESPVNKLCASKISFSVLEQIIV